MPRRNYYGAYGYGVVLRRLLACTVDCVFRLRRAGAVIVADMSVARVCLTLNTSAWSARFIIAMLISLCLFLLVKLFVRLVVMAVRST